MTHEFIDVENIVRGYLKDAANAYCLVHFACCRQILKVSHREKARLSKEIEEKLTKEIEEKLARELEEKKASELEETKEHIL